MDFCIFHILDDEHGGELRAYKRHFKDTVFDGLTEDGIQDELSKIYEGKYIVMHYFSLNKLPTRELVFIISGLASAGILNVG